MKLKNCQTLTSETDFVDAAINIIEQSSRTIRIRSAILDKSLFNSPEVLNKLSAFARHSRFCEVHILIDYPDRIIRSGHGILELNRRLSQKLSIKQFYDDLDDKRDSVLIGDGAGILIKPNAQDQEGYLSVNDQASFKHLAEEFDHDWLRSDYAHDIRRLSI